MTNSIAFDILARDRASRTFTGVGDSAEKSSRKMGLASSALHATGAALKYAGLAAGAGIAATAVAGFKLAQAASEDQASMVMLATALRNNTDATDAQIAGVERQITAWGKAYGVADDKLRPALAALATATGDVHKAQDLTSIAMNVAAQRHVALESVTKKLAKAYTTGSVTALAQYGVKVKDAAGETRTLTDVTADLADKYQGAAAAAADTTAGKWARVKLRFSEVGESIGYDLLPVGDRLADMAVNRLAPAAESLVAAFDAGGVDGFTRELERLTGQQGKLLPILHGAEDVIGNVSQIVAGSAVPAFQALSQVGGGLVTPLGLVVKLLGFMSDHATLTKLAIEAYVVAVTASKVATGLAAVQVKGWGLAAQVTGGQISSLGKSAGIAGGIGGLLALGSALGEVFAENNKLDLENLDRGLQAIAAGQPSKTVNQLVGSLAMLNKGIGGEFQDNMDSFDQSLAQLVESGQSGQAAAVLSNLTAEAERQGVSLAKLSGNLDGYQLALGNVDYSKAGPNAAMIEAALKAGSATSSLAGAARGSAAAHKAEAGAVHQSVQELLKKHDAALGAFDAETQYRQALVDATAAAKANNAGIRGSSEAALDNRQKLSALAGAWNGQSDAVKNSEAKFRDARSAFIDTATGMGVSRDAARDLARQLLDLPKSKAIKVTADNRAAQAAIRDTQQRLDNMRDRHLEIFVTSHNAANAGTHGPTPRMLGQRLGDDVADGFDDAMNRVSASAVSHVKDAIANLKGKQGTLSGLLGQSTSFAGGFQGFAGSIFGAPNPTRTLTSGGGTINGETSDTTTTTSEGPQTIGSLLTYARSQRAQADQVKDDVKSLLAKGLSDELLKQLQTSTGGIEQIHALAGGSRAQIAMFNSLQKGTTADLRAAGVSAADRIYGGQINSAQAAVAAAQQQVKYAQIAAQEIGHQVAEEVGHAFSGAHIVAHGDDLLLVLNRTIRKRGKTPTLSTTSGPR